MNNEASNFSLQPFSVAADARYSIDLAARLAHMPRHRVLVCCKRGFVAPTFDPYEGGYFFDGASIRVLQRIEYLHTDCGVNYTGIEIILNLVDQLERQARWSDD